MAAAGFQDAVVQTVAGTARYASPELLTRAYGSALELQADEQTQARIIADVHAALEACIADDGLAYPTEAVFGRTVR